MRLKRLIAAATFVMSLQALTASAQIIANNGLIVVTNQAAGRAHLIYAPPGNNRVLATNVPNRSATSDWNLNSTVSPRPGIYKTEPYACIVIVPGKQPDDQCVVKPIESGSTMPVIRPKLRFVPLPSK